MGKLALLTLVIVDVVKQVGIKIRPFLEGKLLAEESRGHVLGYQGCFDQQGSAATHRVDEVGIALPSRE